MTVAAFFARRVGYFGMLVALISVVGVSAHPSSSAVGNQIQSSLNVYLDAPLVQGSYVAQEGLSDPNVLAMSFNGATGSGQCGTGAPAGITITGDCWM
jgi:hypothetical protein